MCQIAVQIILGGSCGCSPVVRFISGVCCQRKPRWLVRVILQQLLDRGYCSHDHSFAPPWVSVVFIRKLETWIENGKRSELLLQIWLSECDLVANGACYGNEGPTAAWLGQLAIVKSNLNCTVIKSLRKMFGHLHKNQSGTRIGLCNMTMTQNKPVGPPGIGWKLRNGKSGTSQSPDLYLWTEFFFHYYPSFIFSTTTIYSHSVSLLLHSFLFY